MKYSGIDLHSNNCVIVVIDESDRVLVERRVPNRLECVLEVLAGHAEELAGVVVEATYNWYWLVDGLRKAGYTVTLAHVAALVQYEGRKYGSDVSDARHLAHLLRLGIVPAAYIYEPPQRALRDLGRKRLQLVRERTRHVLAVENILARYNVGRLSGRAIKQLTDEQIQILPLLEWVRQAVMANVMVIRVLDAQVCALEDQLKQALRADEAWRRLQTIPGIGTVLAATIALEMGPVERFAGPGNFASYARCVDSARWSNGKKKGVGNVKNGNKYLAWAFVEAANFARRYCPQAQRFYERKRAHRNSIVAIKALAHKLARAAYHMLREHTVFDPARCFG